MAVNRRRGQRAYGISNALQDLAPLVIVAQRAPTTSDFAEIGTTWVDVPNDDVYVITSIVANSATWTTSPASGAVILASLQVTGPAGIDIDQGDLDVTLGDINVPAGNVVIGGNLNVAGVLTLEPDTSSVAGTSLTINARVGVATFTGQTTASGAQQTFTITNSALGAGDGVFVTVSNRGSNDARMTLERVNTESAGSLVIDTQNNGAASLNGDCVIAFWIIN